MGPIQKKTRHVVCYTRTVDLRAHTESPHVVSYNFLRTKVTRGLVWVVVLGLTGCSWYRLGPTNGSAAGERSVQVKPFINETLEPLLTDAVTQQVRKEVTRDGTYHLATHGDADVVVSGVLTHYDRLELSFIPTDVLTVRDYRLRLTAQVTARERSTGKVLFEQPVNGTTLIRVGNDLTSVERQAFPMLADDLAKNVTALLVDGKF